ncbi:hypothetical protein [Streptomyces umbrinus]|uniref:hypothetical protein n=1 Tax=Streptomyces umbrinus TaxID=67370 RepID=UPI0033C10252
MSEIQASSTELTSQYIAQITGDLERNTKEQERIGAEVDALQEQLRTLQHDHTVLVNMQQALDGATPAGETATKAAVSVPSQAPAEPKRSRPKKTAAAGAGKAAPKKPAEASSAKASKAAGKPSLVDLIRNLLQQQNEPRSAAEISSALTQAHPDRTIKTTVVRTTVEGLVARSHAHRTKQGSSVFYTAATAPQSAEPEPQPEATAG